MCNLIDKFPKNVVIKVIGVGGCGGNAVTYMVNSLLEGVEFICVNTDIQALKTTSASIILQLGKNITKGLGAGANPDIGKYSAIESKEDIRKILLNTDMLFIIAGMGGGTGTGAAPIIAEIAKELNVLTIAVVTRPFLMEGIKRMKVAEHGILSLKKIVDSLIVISNENLLNNFSNNITLLDVFKSVNKVLLCAVQSLSELIIKPGLINVDFADVKTVMSEMGISVIATGIGIGINKARIAFKNAINSNFLNCVNLFEAKGVLVNITSGSDISVLEFKEICNLIKDFSSINTTLIIGSVIDDSFFERLKVTLVITGLSYNSEYYFSQKTNFNVLNRINRLSGNLR